MERGIIASSGRLVPVADGGGHSIEFLSAEDIRYYLMYWNKIIIPDSNIISIEVPDQDVLIQTGVIERPIIRFPFGNPQMHAQQTIESQAIVAKQLMEVQPDTEWIIHQIGEQLIIPTEFSVDLSLMKVNLINALPVPSANVPIEDVLDFKYRRNAELVALHECLDAMHKDIINHPNIPPERNNALARACQAIYEVNQVATERWKVTQKYDLWAEVNLSGDLIKSATAGAALDYFLNNQIDIRLSAIIGGAIGLLKVGAKVTKSFEPAKNNLKLSYVSHAHRENILK